MFGKYGKCETGHWAIWLGNECFAGHISREENAQRMLELMDWDKGGLRPEWMKSEIAPRVGGIVKKVPKPKTNDPAPEPEPQQSWTRSQWRAHLGKTENHVHDHGDADAAR